MRPTAATQIEFTPVFVNYNGTEIFTQAIIHPHGPLIGGSFKLTLGGYPIKSGGNANLPAGISAGALQTAIRTSIPGFGNTVVNIISDAFWQAYGATWIITYYGVNTLIPELTLDFNNLHGGVAGTSPQMNSNTLRWYSSHLLFDPIDFTLLNTASSQANVLVTVNNIPSVCTGDCKYSFLANTPVLQTATRSGSIVTLSLTDPGSIGYSLSDVNIVIGGQNCTVINVADPIGNFRCQLPVNSDSTATVPSGSHMPIVTVSQVGLISPLPAVTPFNFPLTLTSLNFTQGAESGGYVLKLIGKGFPLLIAGAKVNICGVEATITSINNI